MSNTMHSLVEKYISFADKLAGLKKRSLPRHIDIEELRCAAYLGLVEAATRYDAAKGFEFTTFAWPRVWGALNDYLRSLGLNLKSLDSDSQAGVLKDLLVAKRDSSNFEETLSIVAKDLGSQAKLILRLYFVESFSMKQIGEHLGISESRVSQLLTGYKNNIRQLWNEQQLRAELAA